MENLDTTTLPVPEKSVRSRPQFYNYLWQIAFVIVSYLLAALIRYLQLMPPWRMSFFLWLGAVALYLIAMRLLRNRPAVAALWSLRRLWWFPLGFLLGGVFFLAPIALTENVYELSSLMVQFPTLLLDPAILLGSIFLVLKIYGPVLANIKRSHYFPFALFTGILMGGLTVMQWTGYDMVWNQATMIYAAFIFLIMAFITYCTLLFRSIWAGFGLLISYHCFDRLLMLLPDAYLFLTARLPWLIAVVFVLFFGIIVWRYWRRRGEGLGLRT